MYRCINRIAHYVFTVGAQTTKRIRDQEKATALQTAEMVAEAPMTAAALESGKKQKELQSYTKRVQKITGTEFVVVMDMNGIRKTHPDPSKIGKNSEAVMSPRY